MAKFLARETASPRTTDGLTSVLLAADPELSTHVQPRGSLPKTFALWGREGGSVERDPVSCAMGLILVGVTPGEGV